MSLRLNTMRTFASADLEVELAIKQKSHSPTKMELSECIFVLQQTKLSRFDRETVKKKSPWPGGEGTCPACDNDRFRCLL